MKIGFHKEKKELTRSCYPTCPSRLNGSGTCLRSPSITLISDKVLYMENPKDPNNVIYLNKNPIILRPIEVCPFFRKSIEQKVTSPQVEEDDLLSIPTSSNSPQQSPIPEQSSTNSTSNYSFLSGIYTSITHFVEEYI
jgi:hypothetical protein